MPHVKKDNPRFDPVKHGEALEAALVETRFQQGALVEQGDVDSMVLLGSMHFRGQGGPQDFAEARRLFQMAADLGSAAARTNLARMHMKGEGGPEDFVEARRLLDLAIEQGDDDAQVVLGHMYFNGQGAPTDFAEARKAYGVAAERGHADAQTMLEVGAACRERGLGVIDAPVSGGPKEAADGTLVLLLGGSDADMARAKPVFDALGVV